jgi:hypothetical protein
MKRTWPKGAIIVPIKDGLPRDVPHVTWINISDDDLVIMLPGSSGVVLPSDGAIQMLVDDLAKWPAVEAWFEGLELAGKLEVQ